MAELDRTFFTIVIMLGLNGYKRYIDELDSV